MGTIDRLAMFPVLLRDVVSNAPAALLRTRARDGRFSLVEHSWHLADLEDEGFGVRIRRLLDEERPILPNFAGDLIAEERHYLEQPAMPAVERFASQRERNRECLAGLQPADLQRAGLQEGVGEVSLARLTTMMLEHDIGHANDLVALLPELGLEVPTALARFAAGARMHPGV
jgi:hypothetical protein